jgi:hypothetical protein
MDESDDGRQSRDFKGIWGFRVRPLSSRQIVSLM